MAWFYLIVAGLLEVVWAYSMKQSEGFTRFVPSVITILVMIASFGLLSLSMKSLPLGTAYMVWTGIGAIGAFLVGLVMLGEPIHWLRLTAAIMITLGVVAMKIASDR